MKFIILGLLTFTSITASAKAISYPELIQVSADVTAYLTGYPKAEVERKVAESIYKNMGYINYNAEVVLESIEDKSPLYLASKSSSVCAELWGNRDACKDGIRRALENKIKK